MPQKPTGTTPDTWRKLSHVQQAFLRAYLDNGGNAISAYQAAGYTPKGEQAHEQLQRNASSVLHGQRVSQALFEHQRHQDELQRLRDDRAVEWIVLEHERLMAAAEADGDLAVATRNLELIGRTRGAYSDVQQVDVVARREYSEAEQAEARRLARLMLDDAPEALAAGQGLAGDDDGGGDDRAELPPEPS